MHTIALHLVVATTLAAYRLSPIPASATRTVVQATGGVTAVLVALVIVLVAVTASAARALGALLAELLRATVKLTYALLTMVTITALAVALLIHH